MHSCTQQIGHLFLYVTARFNWFSTLVLRMTLSRYATVNDPTTLCYKFKELMYIDALDTSEIKIPRIIPTQEYQ